MTYIIVKDGHPVAVADLATRVVTPCGIRRRSSGIPCRKLRDHEVNRIAAGLAVERY